MAEVVGMHTGGTVVLLFVKRLGLIGCSLLVLATLSSSSSSSRSSSNHCLEQQ
jgi:hypothetical protein